MDLLDVIDPNFNLVEDKYSGKKFGKEGQLTVIGWSGKYRSARIYILRCDICKEDRELYGEGYFKSKMSNLNSGRIPCGCAKGRKNNSEKQYQLEAKRSCEALGLNFIGWVGSFLGNKTFCEIECREHGLYRTTTLSSLLNQNSGCRKCGLKDVHSRFKKSDEDLVLNFMKTGVFAGETLFERSERTDKRGHRGFWKVSCPVCNVSVESHYSNLRVGKIPCLCSSQEKMTQAYIHIVQHDGLDICLKYGISSLTERRLKEQSRSCIYSMRNFGVWRFENFVDCRKAENIIKASLGYGVLSKEELPDGFTETTWLYNLDAVVEIYEKYGGIKDEQL